MKTWGWVLLVAVSHQTQATWGSVTWNRDQKLRSYSQAISNVDEMPAFLLNDTAQLRAEFRTPGEGNISNQLPAFRYQVFLAHLGLHPKVYPEFLIPPEPSSSTDAKSNINLLVFGFHELFTFQSTHSGANLATQFLWEPYYRFSKPWALGVGLGVSGHTSNLGLFPTVRYQFSGAYLGIHPRFHPELFAGGETWVVSKGGTYPLAGVAGHYHPRWKVLGVKIESVFVEYASILVPDNMVNQFSIGIRLNLNPIKPSTSNHRTEMAILSGYTTAIAEKHNEELVIRFGGSVAFKTGKSHLTKAASADLIKIAGLLVKDRLYSIQIEGHTDSSGSELANLKISRERANAVADVLKRQGIASSRIRSIGLGSSKPFATNNTAAGRKANRRAEIHLIIPK